MATQGDVTEEAPAVHLALVFHVGCLSLKADGGGADRRGGRAGCAALLCCCWRGAYSSRRVALVLEMVDGTLVFFFFPNYLLKNQVAHVRHG